MNFPSTRGDAEEDHQFGEEEPKETRRDERRRSFLCGQKFSQCARNPNSMDTQNQRQTESESSWGVGVIKIFLRRRRRRPNRSRLWAAISVSIAHSQLVLGIPSPSPLQTSDEDDDGGCVNTNKTLASRITVEKSQKLEIYIRRMKSFKSTTFNTSSAVDGVNKM